MIDDYEHLDEPLDVSWAQDVPEPSPIDDARSPLKVSAHEIGGMAHDLVDSAIKSALRKEVSKLATTAVDDALTEDVLDALQEHTTKAVAAAIDDATETPTEPTASDEEAPEPAPTLLYETMEHFVTDYLAWMYEVPTSNGKRAWCPTWWKHPGAVIRIQALWLAWEGLRREGATGLAHWIVQYADPIMNVLFDPDGIFKACTIERGHRNERPNPDGRLPSEPTSDGLLEQRGG